MLLFAHVFAVILQNKNQFGSSVIETTSIKIKLG